jgi:hypothetical protein
LPFRSNMTPNQPRNPLPKPQALQILLPDPLMPHPSHSMGTHPHLDVFRCVEGQELADVVQEGCDYRVVIAS